MTELRLRHRARMREKDVKKLNEDLQASLGFAAPPFPAETERAEVTPEMDVLIVKGAITGVVLKGGAGGAEERAWMSVRGLLQNKPPKRFVTVDMGAVKFVLNGADVMAPGIVEADAQIQPGDLVWIRDERNKQPLAIGEALVPGSAMPRGPKGKAVKAIHHVGDELWNVTL